MAKLEDQTGSLSEKMLLYEDLNTIMCLLLTWPAS